MEFNKAHLNAGFDGFSSKIAAKNLPSEGTLGLSDVIPEPVHRFLSMNDSASSRPYTE